MMTASDFLRIEIQTPFRYGVADCCLRLADWWMFARGGDDPAAHLRGTYSDARACRLMCVRAGGLLRIVTTLAETVGAGPACGQDGDFGLALVDGRPRGFIRSGDRLSVRTETGTAFVTAAPVLAGWSPW